MQQKVVTNTAALEKIEKKAYENMWDSEYLAFLFAGVIKQNPEAMSAYAFKRLDKILLELAKREMN